MTSPALKLEVEKFQARCLAPRLIPDFESEAWMELADPSCGHIEVLFNTHPDAMVQAILHHCGLTRGYYTTSDLVIGKDQQRVAGWIEQRIREIKMRQLEEYIDAGMLS